VLDTLRLDYHVPEPVIVELCDTVGRRVANLVDDAVTQRKVPAGYYVLRHLFANNWLR
jgi:hypothetical protein